MIYSLIKVADKLEYNLYSYASERLLNALKAKYPDLKAKLDRFKGKNKYIVWLANRFGENPTKQDHPIQQCIDILFNYFKKENGLAEKYKKEEFRNLVKTLTKTEQFPEGKTYTDLKFIEDITSDEMRAILLASERKKEVVPTAADVDFSGDKVGKVGEWNIWLPSSRDNSIHIAQFDTDDAGNKTPKTTWCTARTNASNLFYHYIVDEYGQKGMLFYVIKDNPEGDWDYLSIGFTKGEPILHGEDGNYGVSINRDQKGLSVEKLQDIWGDNYYTIMGMMQKKYDELGGTSPAYPKLEEGSKDLNKFKELALGNSQYEKEDLLLKIANNFDLSDSFLKDLGEKDSKSLYYLAQSTSKEELIKLFLKSDHLKMAVAKNMRAGVEVLEALAKDPDVDIRSEVVFNIFAGNSRTEKMISVLEILAKDKSYEVKDNIIDSIYDGSPSKHIREIVARIFAKDTEVKYKLEAVTLAKKDTSVLRDLLKDLFKYNNDFTERVVHLIEDESLLVELVNSTNLMASVTAISKLSWKNKGHLLIPLLKDEKVNSQVKKNILHEFPNLKSATLFSRINVFYKLASLTN